MANAPSYIRAHDFALDALPEPVGDSLNEEYDKLSNSVNTNINNLDAIQRDDQQLENGIVGPEQMEPGLLAILTTDPNYVGDWTPSDVELVVNGGFDTDLSDWQNVGHSQATWVAGQASFTSNSTPGNAPRLYQNLNLAAGITYNYSFLIAAVNIVNEFGQKADVWLVGPSGQRLSVWEARFGDPAGLQSFQSTPDETGVWTIDAFMSTPQAGTNSMTLDDVSLGAQGHQYFVSDAVSYLSGLYLCLVDHVSGQSFEADLAAGYWVIISGTVKELDRYAATGGTSQAYTANFDPVLVVVDGSYIFLKWHVDCLDSPTLAVDGGAAALLEHHDGRAIEHRDLRAGSISMLVWNTDHWTVHTNVDRRTQIAITSVLNDDTSPAAAENKGAFAFYAMALNTKVWIPSFSFRPLEVGVQTTPIEIHLELAAMTSVADSTVRYQLEAFVCTGYASMDNAAVASVAVDTLTPGGQAEFVIDIDLSIPNDVDFSHMSISIERIDALTGTEHTGDMALFHVEGRL